MRIITIVIADDQLLTREGLRTILDLEDDMKVVGLAKNGEEAYEMVEVFRPKLVLLDIQMPMMNGLAALKRMKRSCPEAIILILTTFIDSSYIVEAMTNGVSGYMLKDMDSDRMIASIHEAVAGQFILPTAVAAQLALSVNKPPEGYANRARTTKLTEREEELAKLIIKGMNNREIADALSVAEGTARNYISSLYGRLGVVDRAQAIIRLQALIDQGIDAIEEV